ncbi:hypothetical protein GCM10010211_81860 [Streptomyces albospinus]|uniref:Methyltransferase type 11 domain-containing protein n=1 Tax=Streptomyces albospinus TaxID=285515 RepID=A0ABQ2VNG3_9ACTN|nr:class I SAM-dependent methyltransferase [Streptomyces albospinus]GGV02128.1 hypothetical protein GCM10010211_81860 [Streptomyces albospinus]
MKTGNDGSFGADRAPDGRSNYEILCDRVAGSRRVLGLGCGDGLLLELLARSDERQLAGLDPSPESPALARRRPALSAVRWEVGRAQDPPFADDSFDACVSHMVLMLMDEVEHVGAEAARVLSPGGVLACVVGGGAVGGEAYDLFVRRSVPRRGRRRSQAGRFPAPSRSISPRRNCVRGLNPTPRWMGRQQMPPDPPHDPQDARPTAATTQQV